MKYIHSLTETTCNKRELCGGKGVSLHRLIQLGYNVPCGFIIDSGAFGIFITDNGLAQELKRELSSINIYDHTTIASASKNLQKIILTAKIQDKVKLELERALLEYKGDKFAVRSSAAFEDGLEHSWAGQFDTFLDVCREDIIDYVKKCWASFFNQRALSYKIAAYNNIDELRLAVVVQEMVASEKAGVAFSVHPTEDQHNRMLIEAVPGYGDSIVSGKAHTFSATLDKERCATVSKPKNDDLLSVDELQLICRHVKKLEEQFESPVDVEWAFSKDKLFFLQVRPITTVNHSSVANVTNRLPNIEEYELTFKVAGLSFLFADMLAHGFQYLDPLFTSDKEGNFSQYFTNEKMKYAAQFGMRWFSAPHGMAAYIEEFTEFYRKNVLLLNEIIASDNLSKSSTRQFFGILSEFLTYYSKTDNEFTDAAFLHQEQNPIISGNLQLLSEFKDKARLWINSLMIEDHSQFSKFCDKMSRFFHLERSDFDCYRVDEILNIFEGITVPQNELGERRLSFCIFYSSGQQAYLSGKTAVDYINKINAKQRTALNFEVKGKVANKTLSIVQGRAMIINVDYGHLDVMNQTISEMEEGDILVAEFTAPELMEACRKAKAIVTDIGGLLSHAAIVSRELGIPCLIGTGNATKTFKTGDQIIIDFDSGIVRHTDENNIHE